MGVDVLNVHRYRENRHKRRRSSKDAVPYRKQTLYLQSNGILQRIKTKHHNKFRREVLEKHGGFVPHAVMNGKRLLTAEVVAMVVQFVRVRAVSKVNK